MTSLPDFGTTLVFIVLVFAVSFGVAYYMAHK